MKKLIVITLALVLLLGGCFMSEDSTKTVQAGDDSLTFTKDTVYILYRETITYSDGTEYYREFDTEDRLPETNFICNGTMSVNGEEVGTCYREYDPLGNLIAEKDGTTDEKYELTYNDAQQVIKKVTFVDGIEATTEEYTYTNGLLTETTVTENSELAKRFVTEYDATGYRDSTTEYDADQNILGITRYERKGSKEIASSYTPDDVLLGYCHNTYSYQDKIVMEECFSPDAELLKTSVWWYLGHSHTSLDIE